MSYDYFLVRLSSPPICSLKEFDSPQRVDDLGISIDEAKDKLMNLDIGVDWDKLEKMEIDYPDGEKPCIFMQALNIGRFEVLICKQEFCYINISGSINSDQSEVVKNIANHMRMSAFDVQTGKRIYLQCE